MSKENREQIVEAHGGALGCFREVSDRIKHQFGKTDGDFDFPDTLEGELLEMVQAGIEQLQPSQCEIVVAGDTIFSGIDEDDVSPIKNAFTVQFVSEGDVFKSSKPGLVEVLGWKGLSDV